MINNYEIRENSLTQGSIFLLFLNADKQGCEDVLRELSSFCKLTDLKVNGFNYVFELSGITNENMLEKVRARLDFISSSVLGVTQTFGGLAKTNIINIEKNAEKKVIKTNTARTSIKKELLQEDNTHKDTAKKAKQEQGLPVINLSKTEFSVSKEQEKEMNFKDIPAESTLVSGDEKLINIEGASLKIEKTMPNIKQEMEQLNASKKESNIPVEEDATKAGKSSVEEENKTLISYSPDEMKNVVVSIEKEKTSFIRNLFGKIKSAMGSNKKQEKNIEERKPLNEKSQLSGLIQNVKEIKKEIIGEVKQEEVKKEKPINPVKEETNPFQNLGEGIIVKKEISSEENASPNTLKREISSNPVSAKLQVDDIFAAETICDFYAKQPEEQTREISTMSGKKESPLDILENTSSMKDNTSTVNETCDESSSSDLFPTPDSGEPIQDMKQEKTKEETFPNQIFEQKEEKTKEIKEEQKEKTEQPAKVDFKKKSTEENIKKESSEDNLEDSSLDKAEETLKEVLAGDEDIIVNEENKGNDEIYSHSNIFKKEEEKTMQERSQQKQQLPARKTLYQKSFRSTLGQRNENRIDSKIDHTLHVATPAKNAKYRNYPIEMPLIPTYTFANMDISAIRFAHAMAMATLDDLGKSNNPFLLQGPGGTGKTHFLHAMGYEISKKIPQSKVLFTNGVRFSRGVQYLLEQGQQEKLDKFFNAAEVLIIDDVHLTAVNEHNREYISKVLNDFLKNKKQIILSSKYPPESLKRFEELVNFKFSLGAIAELKVPNKTHFEKLTNRIVSSSFLDLTEKQVQSFFSEQNNSLGDVARNVKRVKVLSRRIESSGIKKMSYEDILKEMTAINGENENSDIVKKDFEDITTLEKNKENSWGNFGFFFPASQIDKFRWIAFASQETAKSLGINGGFNYALKSAYSTEHIISAAFKIANICDLKGLKGAVILGPAFVECKEPIRDNFYDILTHMLEVMMIRCGTINFEDIKKPSAYVKMLGDILK